MLVVGLFGTAPFVACAQTKTKTASPAPSASVVREQVLAYLAGKTGVAPVVPLLAPGQTPLLWLEEQEASPNQDPLSLFRVTGEALVLSQQLLGDREESRHREGLMLASESANFLAAHLGEEKPLLAHIYQGFILPNISLASVERWRSPSRQRLIESAITAFGQAGEPDAQRRVLEWLLSLNRAPRAGSVQVDANTLDWTRGTLAALLIQPADAPRADLQRALALLQSIKSPDMMGFKHLQTTLEARLLESAVASSSQTTP